MPIHTEPLTEAEASDRFPESVYQLANRWDRYLAIPEVEEAAAAKETFWLNPDRLPFDQAEKELSFTMEDILDAQRRIRRFAPFLASCFPELEESAGIIESPLQDIPLWRTPVEGLGNDRTGRDTKGPCAD